MVSSRSETAGLYCGGVFCAVLLQPPDPLAEAAEIEAEARRTAPSHLNAAEYISGFIRGYEIAFLDRRITEYVSRPENRDAW